MLSQLAYVVVNSPGGLMVSVVLLVLFFAVAFWILRLVNAPAFLTTILYVLAAVVLMLFIIDAFWVAAPGGAVIVR